MSVTSYTTEPEFYQDKETDSVQAHAVNHCSACTVGKEGWPDTKRKALDPGCADGCRVGYAVEQYRGRVLSTGERNGYHDSDFTARIANPDGSTFETVYATTRGWTYFNGAQVDAPPALVALVEERAAAARKAAAAARAVKVAELESRMPAVGKTVKVKSRRSKIPFGTVGRVAWFGVSRYAGYFRRLALQTLPDELERFDRQPGDFRVGIETADGRRVFCSATCVEIVD